MELRPWQHPGGQGAVLAALFSEPLHGCGSPVSPRGLGATLSTPWPRTMHSESVLVKGRGQAVPSGRTWVIFGPSVLPQLSAGSWGASAATSELSRVTGLVVGR